MANKVISMQQIRALIQLLEQRFSLRRIATQLDICRQTVTFYKCRLQSSSLSLRQLRQLPDADLAQVLYAPMVPPDFSDDPRRMDFNGRVAYLLAVIPPSMATGIVIATSTTIIYTYYASIPNIWGIDRLYDQAMAGAIMWIPGNEMQVQIAILLLYRWLSKDAKDEAARGKRVLVGKTV